MRVWSVSITAICTPLGEDKLDVQEYFRSSRRCALVTGARAWGRGAACAQAGGRRLTR